MRQTASIFRYRGIGGGGGGVQAKFHRYLQKMYTFTPIPFVVYELQLIGVKCVAKQ